jgi:hypothetical protein
MKTKLVPKNLSRAFIYAFLGDTFFYFNLSYIDEIKNLREENEKEKLNIISQLEQSELKSNQALNSLRQEHEKQKEEMGTILTN